MVPWDMLAHSLGITISSDADIANQETTLGCLAVFCLFSPKNLQEVKKKKKVQEERLSKLVLPAVKTVSSFGPMYSGGDQLK